MNRELRCITIVFENVNEISFKPDNLFDFWFSVGESTFQLNGSSLCQHKWISELNIVFKESANCYLTDLTGKKTDRDLFTYLHQSDNIAQIVLDYGISEETYYIDDNRTQNVTETPGGLSIYIG